MPQSSLRVRPLGRPLHRAVLQLGADRFAAAIGRSGLSRAKREGDGATPAGILHPRFVYYRSDRWPRPATALPVAAIGPDDGWCDDPDHADYNRPVSLPHPDCQDRLWRDDHLYDAVVVLDWNMTPVRPGRGSAIFLHLARPGFGPTEGCIAVRPEVMRRLLPLVDRDTRIEVG